MCFAQEKSDVDEKDSARPQSSNSQRRSSRTESDYVAKSSLDTASCSVPVNFKGFLLKSRKSPMKGWHKVTRLKLPTDYQWSISVEWCGQCFALHVWVLLLYWCCFCLWYFCSDISSWRKAFWSTESLPLMYVDSCVVYAEHFRMLCTLCAVMFW